MAIFDELKSVASTLREADKIEQYRQILDIQQKLLEMQNHIFDLEKENRELKEAINKKKKLIHRAEVYFLIEGTKEEGPFCANCYDAQGKLMHMIAWNADEKQCPNCKLSYKYV